MAKKKSDFHVCVIGASAGGLDAITQLLNQLPKKSTLLSIIIAQHLSPTHKSRLVELLQKGTNWPVKEASQGEALVAGNILITPPDKDISINKGKVNLTKPSSNIGPKPSVNILFSTAAEYYEEKTLGVILSGSGSDGATGVESIKLAGGITLVQEPREASYDGMPNAAIETGMVDATFNVVEFGNVIDDILTGEFNPTTEENAEDLSDLQKIFALLAGRTGVDFNDYKESTIKRRLESRISQLKINNINAYLNYIEKKPAEVELLFNHVLIGVTQFFRDPHAFEALRTHLQHLIDSKEDKRIRIWIPGCATGEEPNSIAILLSELLGSDLSEYDIQIFATDIDEVAISKARKGYYPKETVELLPTHYVSRYFRQRGNSYEVVKSVRSSILFSRHDVTSNPPFLKLDLVVCRNMLIYFNNDLQKRVIPVFHYALNPGGLLFVGSSEALGTKEHLFQVVDKKNKIFKRKAGMPDRGLRFSSSKYRTPKVAPKPHAKPVPLMDKIKNEFLDSYHQPFVVIDESQEVLYLSGNMAPFLHLPQGAATNNLFKQLNEEIEIDVRSVVSKAIKVVELQMSELKRVKQGDQYFLLRVVVKPITTLTETYFVVIFESMAVREDMVIMQEVSADKKHNSQINELERELLTTKEHLQSYIEELETTNEEMQSLNEELQSANEELQSSNEELETSNEELQSTNEEVQIAYQELKQLNEDLAKKEQTLQSVYSNVNALVNNELQGFILVDQNLAIIEFNKRAREIVMNMNGSILSKGRHFVDLLPSRLSHVFFHFIGFVKDGNPISTKFDVEEQDEINETHLQLNFTPVVSESGQRQTSIGLLDMSNSFLHEREMKKLNNELKRSNEELQSFAYVASHDLQEPVRMIASFTELLSKDLEGKLNEQMTEYMQFVIDGAGRLQNMIRDLLQYSRINTETDVMSDLDMNECVDAAINNLTKKIEEEKATINVSKLPNVKGFRTQLVSVFQNLIDNSLKYRAKRLPKISISASSNQDEYTIKFKDNGIGIDPKFADQVFTIFKRLHPRDGDKGTGIGLALVKRIINRHRGDIWLESDGRNGTTFYLTFPKELEPDN